MVIVSLITSSDVSLGLGGDTGKSHFNINTSTTAVLTTVVVLVVLLQPRMARGVCRDTLVVTVSTSLTSLYFIFCDQASCNVRGSPYSSTYLYYIIILLLLLDIPNMVFWCTVTFYLLYYVGPRVTHTRILILTRTSISGTRSIVIYCLYRGLDSCSGYYFVFRVVSYIMIFKK